MSLRLNSACLVALLALTGCASTHSADHLGGPLEPVADVAVPAPFPPPIDPTPAVVASWSEPTVISAAVTGPQAVADDDGPYLLDTGDKLRIFVYGQPNLSRIYTVDHAGFIGVPLIGAVKTRGKTTYDIEGAIRYLLARQYVKEPHVTVDIAQTRPFFILGEVKTPGQYPYVSGMTVETAVAIGGGYSDRASERRMRVTRRINGLVETILVTPDYVVKPGDTVYVFERYF